jgi:hypothetical protein
MEGEEISDFAAKFAARFAPNIAMQQQSPLCMACREIPFDFLLKDVQRCFFLFETTEPLIDPQNNCELCRLILQSIRAQIDFNNFKGSIAIALSPRFLIIDGIHQLELEFRVSLRLFVDARKQRAL